MTEVDCRESIGETGFAILPGLFRKIIWITFSKRSINQRRVETALACDMLCICPPFSKRLGIPK